MIAFALKQYSVFGIHLGQNKDGKQGRLGILLSLTVIKSAVLKNLYLEEEQKKLD